jgi:Ca2+-binding RTX toxin-like protein
VPVSDATIEGAVSVNPIGGGRYEITVGNGSSTLTAEHAPDVRSNHVETCFRADLAACPKAHGRTIYGSSRDDDLKGTRGFDEIAAAGGDDEVDLRKGGRDRVNCGAGDDTVLVDRGDRDDRIRGSCERIRRA